jgi:hypothetical protein
MCRSRDSDLPASRTAPRGDVEAGSCARVSRIDLQHGTNFPRSGGQLNRFNVDN